MILGINGLGTRGGGGETVLLSLLDGLLRSAIARRHVEKIVLFLLPRDAYAFDYPADERLDIVRCRRITDQPVLRYLWLCSCFGSLVRRHQCDIVINLNSVAGSVPVPQVMFVHNALYFSKEAEDAFALPGVPLSQKWRIRMQMPLARWFIRRSAPRVARIMVQTEVMRMWMERDYPQSKGRIHVLRPATPELPRQRSRGLPAGPGISAMHACQGKRFLYIGSDWSYKNLRVLMEAAQWALVNKREWHFFLSVTGCPEPVSQNVHFLGPVRREELVETYLAADALLMPSLIETVGLPMIEAMTLGIPVVAADRPYAREICEAGARYFDPHNVSTLVEALQQTTGSSRRETDHHQQRQALSKFPKAEVAAELWLEHCLALIPKERFPKEGEAALFHRSHRGAVQASSPAGVGKGA